MNNEGGGEQKEHALEKIGSLATMTVMRRLEEIY